MCVGVLPAYGHAKLLPHLLEIDRSIRGMLKGCAHGGGGGGGGGGGSVERFIMSLCQVGG